MTYADQVKAEVAARYGVPVLCDVKIVARGVSGFDIRPPDVQLLRNPQRRTRANSISDEDYQRIIDLRRQGKPIRAIAREVGRSLAAVHRIACLWN